VLFRLGFDDLNQESRRMQVRLGVGLGGYLLILAGGTPCCFRKIPCGCVRGEAYTSGHGV
jgi:hypothetical protein